MVRFILLEKCLSVLVLAFMSLFINFAYAQAIDTALVEYPHSFVILWGMLFFAIMAKKVEDGVPNTLVFFAAMTIAIVSSPSEFKSAGLGLAIDLIFFLAFINAFMGLSCRSTCNLFNREIAREIEKREKTTSDCVKEVAEEARARMIT